MIIITLFIYIFFQIYIPFWIGMEPLTTLNVKELWIDNDIDGIFLLFLFTLVDLMVISLPWLLGMNWIWGLVPLGATVAGLVKGSYNKRFS